MGERVLAVALGAPGKKSIPSGPDPRYVTVVTTQDNLEVWKGQSGVARCVPWDDFWSVALRSEKFPNILDLDKSPESRAILDSLESPHEVELRSTDQASGDRILVIHLEALGAVLQSTAILPPLKRKFPNAHITWLTSKAALPLLENNALVDRLLSWSPETNEGLLCSRFGTVMSLDKSPGPAALAVQLASQTKHGFGWGAEGNIFPLSSFGEYAFSLGLDNELKFKKNQKTSQEIFCGLADLPFGRDDYQLNLRDQEIKKSRSYRKAQASASDWVIGINTGCADNFPYKKFTISRHHELIDALLKAFPKASVFLLGGRAETQRNMDIASPFTKDSMLKGRVIQTPTTEGLRSGIVYENACDLVISGDTLGMHIAIGLKKKVVAWFSLTCHQEIDVYDRGVKLLADVTCGPCWLSSCDKEPKCYDQVPVADVVRAVGQLL